jgi:hypothetical protein
LAIWNLDKKLNFNFKKISKFLMNKPFDLKMARIFSKSLKKEGYKCSIGLLIVLLRKRLCQFIEIGHIKNGLLALFTLHALKYQGHPKQCLCLFIGQNLKK